jgi:hypothetical protein
MVKRSAILRINAMDKDKCTIEQQQRIKREALFTRDYVRWLADKLTGHTGDDFRLPAAEVLRWVAEGMK